jgi:hypothetical protein
MKLDITQVDVWAATIKDKPGGLAQKLDALAKAGVNLEFLISRRTPEKPGRGVVFVTPIKGAKQVKAAKKAGFKKAQSLRSVRVAALDKPDLGGRLSQQIADAGINLRGLSGAAIGKRAVFHFAFDSAADASRAVRLLKKTK